MKPHNYLLALIVVVCLLVAHGCGTVAHTVGLATTDDLREQVRSQAKVDMKQSNAVADVFDKTETPAGMVNRTREAAQGAVDDTDRRTAPPKDGIDWTTVIMGVLTLATGGGATYATVKANSAHRSIRETDDWIEKDIEPRVKSAPSS